jgi:hypothetical protein
LTTDGSACLQDAPKADAETFTLAEYQVRLLLAQMLAWICLLAAVTPASLCTKCQTKTALPDLHMWLLLQVLIETLTKYAALKARHNPGKR